MPKKRNNAWSRQKKQKQIITSRLMEISLKVDEYVYNCKPISNTEAEQFIKEVESYKVSCNRDDRSLQVIEKLTRCMKAIILEHREEADSDNMNSNICHLQNYRPPSVSPVYSMCEEDLTHFSQADTIANTKDANEVDEIIDLCIDDDENDSGKTAAVDFIRPPPVTVEVDIQRAVSNLSLQELPASEQPDTCSQSILNNFVTNEHIEQNLTNVSDEATPIYLIVNVDKNGKSTYAKSTLQNTEPSKIIKKPLIIRPNTMIKAKSSSTTMSQNINTKSLEDITAKLKIDCRVLKPTNHIVLRQDSNKQAHVSYPGSTKTIVHQEMPVIESNKFSVETSKANAQLYPHETKKKLNKYQNGNTSNIKQKTAKPKKKRAPRKKKNVDTKENEAKSRQPKKMSTQKSKLPPSESDTNSFNYLPNTNTKIPIYNDQVINDLSWMENIRFVREIGVEENDQSLTLEESFWDNYHLPANWTDSEFL